MDGPAKQAFIRKKALESRSDTEGTRILWSRHAVAELVNEGWIRAEVEQCLEAAELVEDYRTLHRPLPDCLVLGRLMRDEPCHAVVAIDEENDRLLIVTVYRPSLEEWEDDWSKRKE